MADELIRYAEALEIISKLEMKSSTKRLPLTACLGHRLAEDIAALVPSPPYTNSAMDGFAVVRDEAARGPLHVGSTIFAGARAKSHADSPRDPMTCVRIMTGGAMPAWADTVIPVEQSKIEKSGTAETVTFATLPNKGANIRECGSDLAAGAPLLLKGTSLDPERIMVAAAFGYDSLPVTLRPKLSFISTGDELIEPGQALPHGAVYNSSKYFLLSSAMSLGLQDTVHRTIADDETAAENAINSLLSDAPTNVLITTGAVSAGEADFLPTVAKRLGFQTLFHKVAIRPGKPVFLAMRDDNAVWLGLPGNPISTSVGWHAFARPLLSRLMGLPEVERRTVVLKNEVRKPEHLRCFFRAEVNGNKVWVGTRQGSAQMAASITNEAYVELPEGFARIPADTRVAAIIL